VKQWFAGEGKCFHPMGGSLEIKEDGRFQKSADIEWIELPR